MRYVVLDTNILVSALWCKDGKPASIVQKVLAQEISLCYDYRILSEYVDVLNREKFSFIPSEIEDIISALEAFGISVVVEQDTAVVDDNITFIHEDDRAFYDVAKFCNASLITGNNRHYPDEPFIMTPAEFLEEYSGY